MKRCVACTNQIGILWVTQWNATITMLTSALSYGELSPIYWTLINHDRINWSTMWDRARMSRCWHDRRCYYLGSISIEPLFPNQQWLVVRLRCPTDDTTNGYSIFVKPWNEETRAYFQLYWKLDHQKWVSIRTCMIKYQYPLRAHRYVMYTSQVLGKEWILNGFNSNEWTITLLAWWQACH